MSKKKKLMAIAYDFDGTLAPGNMPEHSFIPEVGINRPRRFWDEAKAYASKNDMDEILSYMHLMLKKADQNEIAVKKESFVQHGKRIPFFNGVRGWFSRINKYASARGIKLEHYIISSGLREMIEGTSISKKFEYVFASGFMYNQNGVAVWPALAINYTTKTQYLFRINKGIKNSHDNGKINKFMPLKRRRIPFDRIVYIGDGETDIPCMKLVRQQGGYAIAVYKPNVRKVKKGGSPKTKAFKLIEQERASYAVPADYSTGKPLDILVKAIIDRVSANSLLEDIF